MGDAMSVLRACNLVLLPLVGADLADPAVPGMLFLQRAGLHQEAVTRLEEGALPDRSPWRDGALPGARGGLRAAPAPAASPEGH
jgi:hypothetical protein